MSKQTNIRNQRTTFVVSASSKELRMTYLYAANRNTSGGVLNSSQESSAAQLIKSEPSNFPNQARGVTLQPLCAQHLDSEFSSSMLLYVLVSISVQISYKLELDESKFVIYFEILSQN